MTTGPSTGFEILVRGVRTAFVQSSRFLERRSHCGGRPAFPFATFLTILPAPMNPTVYIETSIVSYLTTRPSRDLIVAAHQQITHEWWRTVRPKVQCLISPYVIDEASQGDQQAAQKRLEAVAGFPILTLNEEIKALALKYQAAAQIPEKAKLEAFHLAFPAWHKIDYLLTWNCKHIANANVRKIIENLNRQINIHTPNICTPEEFMEV